MSRRSAARSSRFRTTHAAALEELCHAAPRPVALSRGLGGWSQLVSPVSLKLLLLLLLLSRLSPFLRLLLPSLLSLILLLLLLSRGPPRCSAWAARTRGASASLPRSG